MNASDWQAALPARVPGLTAAPMICLAASVLANPASSSDTLLVLADALREVAREAAAQGSRADVTGPVLGLADLLAAEAPARAGPAAEGPAP